MFSHPPIEANSTWQLYKLIVCFKHRNSIYLYVKSRAFGVKVKYNVLRRKSLNSIPIATTRQDAIKVEMWR